jgi:hypothetical protein
MSNREIYERYPNLFEAMVDREIAFRRMEAEEKAAQSAPNRPIRGTRRPAR